MIGAVDRLARSSVRPDELGDAAAGLLAPVGTLAHTLMQPSPLDRLISGAGALARYLPADPSPLAAPGMTIRRNEILPDIAQRHVGNGAMGNHYQPSEPLLQTSYALASDVSLAARIEATSVALSRSDSALAPSARIEPTARVQTAPASDRVTRAGDGQPG